MALLRGKKHRARTARATNTEKVIMLSLAEGWRLRFADTHGWCLFQHRRERPFAKVKTDTVERMTANGWLSSGVATKQLAFLPEKVLTPDGLRCALKLIKLHWAEEYEWCPYPPRGAKNPSSTAHGYLAA